MLITGGSGFIGQHLVAAATARGDAVRVLDLQPPRLHLPREFIQGSILDPACVRRAMEGVDTVYHLAGIAHFWTPDPEDFDRANHQGTETVLSVAAELGVRRFVHCSSETVMFPANGHGPGSPTLVEDMAGPYTRSKFLAELAALDAARNGLPVVVVNPTVPIGPGDHNRTAPTAMVSLFLNHPPLFVMDCILNVVDVRDVVTGIMLAADHGRVGERYILGGEILTVRELIRRIDAICGRRTTTFNIPGFAALAAGFAAEWYSNHISQRMPLATPEAVRVALRSIPLEIDKAREDLGYRPRAIDGALAETVAWLSRADATVRDAMKRLPESYSSPR
ncbi:NAD-dependent epimerase/dehydratase family protein [Rhodoligotrophos defluvii]|uniref:NAD-dependent epimerase/dehydratase family protein n=1 Tax=Rhodoligotrophos defluvii TaxID=2561934 RepID=UPI001EEF8D9D|nr:NAD-dependent epimerase/dehydratase family protein [Rhodoligotrophos defluvii]